MVHVSAVLVLHKLCFNFVKICTIMQGYPNFERRNVKTFKGYISDRF